MIRARSLQERKAQIAASIDPSVDAFTAARRYANDLTAAREEYDQDGEAAEVYGYPPSSLPAPPSVGVNPRPRTDQQSDITMGLGQRFGRLNAGRNLRTDEMGQAHQYAAGRLAGAAASKWTSPYPATGRSPGIKPDRNFPAPGQTTGVPGPADPKGRGLGFDMIGMIGDYFKVRSDLADTRVYGEFLTYGGEDQVEKRRYPDRTSIAPLLLNIAPLLLNDINGGTGFRMDNGVEFWKMRLAYDPNPDSINVVIRRVPDQSSKDGYSLRYKYGDFKEWRSDPPPAHQE